MADYSQPDVVQKRVRFFDGQFLQDQDFIDEQRYHLDRERRQSKLLNITGIVSGLTVTSTGTYQVTVAKGVAVDDLGRQLVLVDDLPLDLTKEFAKQQNIEVRLIYRQTPTEDTPPIGSGNFRRWDESPMIAAIANGIVAVAPDGAPTEWNGPTVLLAQLAVAENGAVTVNATADCKAGLSVPGAVGIGSYSVEYDERTETGNGLHIRTHSHDVDGMTRLFVGWDGNVGIGTTSSEAKLAVSSSSQHLQLRRENTETTGGKQLFLELFQHDPVWGNLRSEVHPSIRFHHYNIFWHRIEAQLSGFHLKTGDLSKDDYSDIKAGNIYATGKLEVTGDVSAAGFLGASGDMTVGTKSNNALRFVTNGATRLSIDADGTVSAAGWVSAGAFVGAPVGTIVGTRLSFVTSGATRLSIDAAGNVRAFGDVSVDGAVSAAGFLGASGDMTVGTKSNNALSFVTNGATRLSIDAAGNISAAGDISAAGFLGASGDMTVGTKSAKALRFVTNGATRLSIDGDGFISVIKHLDVVGGGGQNVDLVVNGRLRSNNNDGGLWVAQDRFVGGHDTNQIGFWNGKDWRLTVLPDGKVGIGTINPDCLLTVNGHIKVCDIYSTGRLLFSPVEERIPRAGFDLKEQRYWFIYRKGWGVDDFSDGMPSLRASDIAYPSDTRLKNGVTEIASALEKIQRLRGVSFTWNEQGLRHLTGDIESMISAGPGATAAENQLVWDALRECCYAKLARRNIGLLAEEVEQVVPELVYTNAGGYKCVDYSKLTAVLVQAVKEQQASIQQLRDRLVTLERVTT